MRQKMYFTDVRRIT